MKLKRYFRADRYATAAGFVFCVCASVVDILSLASPLR